MSTTILIKRRAKVQKLTALAQQDRNTLKIFQGYRLLHQIDSALASASNLKNLYRP